MAVPHVLRPGINGRRHWWFIPYVMAIFLLAIPILILEIATGQAYRAGSVAAYNSVDKRFKGIGLGVRPFDRWFKLHQIRFLAANPCLVYMRRLYGSSILCPDAWLCNGVLPSLVHEQLCVDR